MELKDLEKQDEGKLAMQLSESVDDVAADSYSDIKLRDKSQVPFFMRSMVTPYMIVICFCYDHNYFYYFHT